MCVHVHVRVKPVTITLLFSALFCLCSLFALAVQVTKTPKRIANPRSRLNKSNQKRLIEVGYLKAARQYTCFSLART